MHVHFVCSLFSCVFVVHAQLFFFVGIWNAVCETFKQTRNGWVFYYFYSISLHFSFLFAFICVFSATDTHRNNLTECVNMYVTVANAVWLLSMITFRLSSCTFACNRKKLRHHVTRNQWSRFKHLRCLHSILWPLQECQSDFEQTSIERKRRKKNRTYEWHWPSIDPIDEHH